MATIKIKLDTRVVTTNKKGENNLVIRVSHQRKHLDLKIGSLTVSQYKQIFIKKSLDPHSVEYRERSSQLLTKSERIFRELGDLNKKEIRHRFYSKNPKEEFNIDHRLYIKKLFDLLISESPNLKISTKARYRATSNILYSYNNELTVESITPSFLREFEVNGLKKGKSLATISSYLVDLRRLINFTNEKGFLPTNYNYPFGGQGYRIRQVFNFKHVLPSKELKVMIHLEEFESPNEEKARDIWLFLYLCNGINMIDAFQMKWTDIKGNCITIIREKTRTRRKNDQKPIIIPITKELDHLIKKIGVNESNYILGMINSNIYNQTFYNKLHKTKKKINKDLKAIEERLNLSVPLRLKSARVTYATTLLRKDVSKDTIGEMLGHANSVVTEHYLAGLDTDKIHKINEGLV